MKPNEPLHDCPKCGRKNFTARGLAAHACKVAALALPEAEVTACAARFKRLQEALKQTVAGTKLLKYFLGLEVSNLCALHEELHGETRGGDVKSAEAKIKTEAPSVLKLEAFLEDHLGVTARTARKYRDFFESLTTGTEHEATVKRLNSFWMGQREGLLALPSTGDTKAATGGAALSLQSLGGIAEKDLQTILDHADEWGLNELFAVPLKDVSTTVEAAEEGSASVQTNKHKLAKFWLQDFSRRAMNNEFLKLPKREKEALLTTLEEATDTLKQHLKGGKK
jgi:hypothetical protein